MTWSDDANIWLYKNSSGDIVLYGSAPDQGAHESNHQGTGQFGSGVPVQIGSGVPVVIQ